MQTTWVACLCTQLANCGELKQICQPVPPTLRREMDPATDPPTAGSFLSRYREAKAPVLEKDVSSVPGAGAPEAGGVAGGGGGGGGAPTSPRAIPKPKDVWASTFHPGGRSPRSAARFDSRSASGDGKSVSEMHDAGRAGVGVAGKIDDE